MRVKYSNPILKHTLKKMPWSIIPFALSLFVLVASLEYYGVTTQISEFLMSNFLHTEANFVYLYGVLSTLTANFLNNIPMSVLFIPLISSIPEEFQLKTAYSVIIGSNFGANLTPLGALAGILWMTILKNHGFKLSFFKFMGYGIPVTLLTLMTALTVLILF